MALEHDSVILPPDQLCVFTVATKYMIGLHNWQESLVTQEFSYRILGFGDQWKGWRYRMETYRNALLSWSEKYGDASIVILSDAYDVLFIRKSTDGILNTYKKFNKPIVVSIEKGCGLNCGLITEWWNENKSHIKNITNNNRYMCAGLIMGECKALATALTWALDHGYKDDQIGLSSYVQVFPHLVWADYKSEIFRTKQDDFYLSEPEKGQFGAYALHFPSLRIAPFFSPSTEAAKRFAGQRGIHATDFTGVHYLWKYVAVIFGITLLVMSFKSGLNACRLHYDTILKK
jgi:hypothetical protein